MFMSKSEIASSANFWTEFMWALVSFEGRMDWASPNSKLRDVWLAVGEFFVRCFCVSATGCAVVHICHVADGKGPEPGWYAGVVKHAGDSRLHGLPETFNATILGLSVRGGKTLNDSGFVADSSCVI